ncbi:MAG: hypothetical protein LBV44_05315 [Methylobacillus sp.]|nr:hypothetical protein [Methylobacillus sp.]
MKKLFAILFLLTLASPAAAENTLYKCTVNGKSVYTDFPSSPNCKEMKNGRVAAKPKPQAPLETIPPTPKEDKAAAGATEPTKPTNAANTDAVAKDVPAKTAN